MTEILNKLKHALPSFPDIAGRDELKNFAVMALVADIEGEPSFIFEKRVQGIRQGGEVCFPGGMFEEDVDFTTMDTARRETMEELGTEVEIIGRGDTIFAHMGVVIDMYVGYTTVKSIDEFTINPAEVEKVFSVPIKYFTTNKPEKYKLRLEIHPFYIDEKGTEVTTFPAKDLGLPEIYHQSWGNTFTDVYLYRVAGEVIWGITGRIVYSLIKLIQ